MCKRWKVLIVLVLGMLTNALVAWSCSLWSQPAFVCILQATDKVPRWMQIEVPAAWLAPGILASTPDVNVSYVVYRSFGSTAVLATADDEAKPGTLIQGFHTQWKWRVGWPLGSFRCETDWPAPTSKQVSGGMPAPTWLLSTLTPTVDGPSFRVLPYRPIFVTFCANTLLYCIIWASVLAGALHLRQAFRKSAGRCPSCGYDRAGLAPAAACPECGAVPGTPSK